MTHKYFAAGLSVAVLLLGFVATTLLVESSAAGELLVPATAGRQPQTTLTCSTPNLAIPDNYPTGVTNDLTIAASETITDVNIYLDVNHTWVGDLKFIITHLSTGTSVTIVDRPGIPGSQFGCGVADIDAWLDDDASSPVEEQCAAVPPAISGTFTPNQSLTAFNGQNSSGTWRITASDNSQFDTGTLVTWCVQTNSPVSGVGEPEIAVAPSSLSSALGPDDAATWPLTIENSGTTTLTWTIEEAPPTGDRPAAPLLVEEGEADAGEKPGFWPSRYDWRAPRNQVFSGFWLGRPPAKRPAPLTNVVNDGGFELGTPNPYWDESSTNFGTPLCTVALCGGAGGGTGPHSGSWWAWFGGIDLLEISSLDQDVTIPEGAATLSFWLEIAAVNTTGYLAVYMDGDELFRVTEADAPIYDPYTEVVLDVGEYADGGVHNLEFFSITNAGAGPLNFFVDDVELDVTGSLGCATPSELSWLTVAPESGATPAGQTSVVNVTFDSTGLPGGVYYGTLCINSDDDDEPLVSVPLTLTVSPWENPAFVPLIRYAVRVDEPNDTCEQAFSVSINRDLFFYPDDAADWYEFDLTSSGDLVVELTNFVPEEGQVAVYKGASCGARTFLGSDGTPGTNKTVVVSNQTAGHYYIFVSNDGVFNSSDLYKLRIEYP
ncbi:MAG: hypothetical protein AB1791_05935 [Chloroflexota bacterium]